MLAIVHLSGAALTDRGSLATLAAVAAEHELVLVYATAVTSQVLPALRAALPRRQIVGLLVSGEVTAHERRLVTELLDEGAVPLILTTDDPTTARLANWAWLAADASYVLPDVID
jgi:hypothetical protein